eukprot:m.34334 g.34334  ORF g.34334 m.34334 type:complete len:320 (-) comp6522_c0_seq1:128-1087(-)
MNFFGFGQTATIDIDINAVKGRDLVPVQQVVDGKVEKQALFYDGESLSGTVSINLKHVGKKLEHNGIKVEFLGLIELAYDRGNQHDFVELVKELAPPGELMQSKTYSFEFRNAEKTFETYRGINARLKYVVRVTILRRISDIVSEQEITVHSLASFPEINNSIKMEVGIEDCLHIEFEYNRSKYHLRDVIVGKIYFLLVRIKISNMELSIIRRETTTASGSQAAYTENKTITKYEIMDGAPVKGESIPIRLFLAGFDLTPTMQNVNKKFSVRYYLNLVLVDEEERRYYKQQEIVLWRKAKPTSKAKRLAASTLQHTKNS